MSRINALRSFERLNTAVEACLHPTQFWLKVTFRQHLGRDVAELEASSRDFAQTLVQVEMITALLLSYRIEQLALPPERQDRSTLTPERLGISRDSLLYHPAHRALAPVTVLTRLEETATSHTLLNSTDERYEAGRRLDPKYAHCAGWFGYGALDTRGREMWTTLPNGKPIRCANDTTILAANPWTSKSYAVGKSLKFIREWGTERCVGFTFLCDEQKRVIAQHCLLFLPLYMMDIETTPTIEMRLQDDILKLRSDVFVWRVVLEGREAGDLSDNVFDLLPGIPYSLPWDEAICPTPKILRTGNSLLQKEQ